VIKPSSSGRCSIYTFIHKHVKEAPGHKTYRCGLALVLCGSDAGHVIKLSKTKPKSCILREQVHAHPYLLL
jgi:hypothetical protein